MAQATPTGRFRVVVVGSANVDLEVRVPRWPDPGESVVVSTSERFPGGKGANQAIAAAKAGGVATALISAWGADADGALLESFVREAGVDTSAVRAVDCPTGMAIVMVDPLGANVITVVAGANSRVELAPKDLEMIATSRVVLTQLEVPVPTVVKAAQAARAAGAIFVLNAAPMVEIPAELLANVDVLVVSQHGARELAAQHFGMYPSDDGPLLSALQRLVPSIVMTKGAEGSVVAQAGQDPEVVHALPVEPVDHTGAGDTFNGVLAARLSQGAALGEAARAATAAASISLNRPGAGPSIPTAREVARALATGQVPPIDHPDNPSNKDHS
ncbi:MAG: PfkB family carbohydrate kinase [Bifidobacteriaceae bacterium]|jgi:ribokinase|nr:PfkB family carbohydrate kinase [Bifidobacteriaceae bacterium]